MPQNSEKSKFLKVNEEKGINFFVLPNGDLVITCKKEQVIRRPTAIQLVISAEQLSQLAAQSKEAYDQYQFNRSNL